MISYTSNLSCRKAKVPQLFTLLMIILESFYQLFILHGQRKSQKNQILSVKKNTNYNINYNIHSRKEKKKKTKKLNI